MKNSKSILIVGSAKDEYLNGDIKLVETIDKANKLYGEDSQLTKAYKEAIAVGCSADIYLCNAHKYTDYISSLKYISGYRFDFVLPLFKIDDKFSSKSGKTYYLAEIYSNAFIDSTTEIIITGEHASKFEDIQHFIDYCTLRINKFKLETLGKLSFSYNLSFVCNNLKNKEYANVILASILLCRDMKEYPTLSGEEAIFDIRHSDFVDCECVFFENAFREGKVFPYNLVNLAEEKDPFKSILNNMARKYVLKKVDLDDFKGKAFSNHSKMLIENVIKTSIDKAVGEIIEDGYLVRMDVNRFETMEVEIISTIRIKPFFFNEYIEISEEM